MNSISPATASTQGNSIVTITGSGFQGIELDVYFGSKKCTSLEIVAHNKVTCIVPAHLGVLAAQMRWWITDSEHKNEVECEGSCEITFEMKSTPEIKKLSPDEMSSSNTEFTINGNKFGDDLDAVTVTFGTYDCPVSTCTETLIKCNMPYLPLGKHQINVHIAGFGNALNQDSLTATSIMNFNGITPLIYSPYGDGEMQISVYGLDISEMVYLYFGNEYQDESAPLTEEAVEFKIPSKAEVNGIGNPKISWSSYEIDLTDFSYDSEDSPAVTPVISSVSKTLVDDQGYQSYNLIISGSNLASAVFNVKKNCAVTSATDTLVECKLGFHPAGSWELVSTVDKVGNSKPYDLEISLDTDLSLSHSTGEYSF